MATFESEALAFEKKEKKRPYLRLSGTPRPSRTLSCRSREASRRPAVRCNPSVCKDIDGAKGVQLQLESGVHADFVSVSVRVLV